jgi:hypothetical protein
VCLWHHRRVSWRDESAARVLTAPLAAAGLIACFGVAAATGSRLLGGLVLAAFGLSCIAVWLRRDGRRTAIRLTVAGLLAFGISHLLGLLIGAWPAVLVVAGAAATACWRVSDSRRPDVRPAAAGSRRTQRRPDRPEPSA